MGIELEHAPGVKVHQSANDNLALTASSPPTTAARIGELAARIHAATAELVKLTAEFDASQAWAGDGIRSCAHWLTIATGHSTGSATELLRVGHSLSELPVLAAAFADGRLSLDKVRAVTTVATAEDQAMWLEMALHASGSQLIRICRAVHRVLEDSAPDQATSSLKRRQLQHWWRDDGMLQLNATLPAEDGAVVLAAIATALPDLAQPPVTGPVAEPSFDPAAAARADALALACSRALAGRDDPASARPELVVHVDAALLAEGTAADPGRRSHIEAGPALSPDTIRRLGCDATVVTITERDGVPVDVGRARRLVSGRLRRALQVRDTGCRFPGCNVSARATHGHHLRPWANGGRTDLANLISLCGFHHRRLHDGAYHIDLGAQGQPRFLSAAGQPIVPGPAPLAPSSNPAEARLATELQVGIDHARARDGGARYDRHWAVSIVAEAAVAARYRSRAGPAVVEFAR